jgi:hypothetical protein
MLLDWLIPATHTPMDHYEFSLVGPSAEAPPQYIGTILDLYVGCAHLNT